MLANLTHDTDLPEADTPISIDEFAQIVREAINQPPWRVNADKEADYADGNQLDSELLQKQKALGIPPAKENIIGPAIAAVCGYEAKTRTDWRVTPDGDPGGQDVADALNYRLNQAERHSHADRALSEAFRPGAAVGIGFVEVASASNSLQFPYKCRYVHRNEIWWDMSSREPDMSDAQWLFRRRWVNRKRAARMFPEHRDIILREADKWIADMAGEMLEGGQSTGLAQAMEAERAWTVQEDAWFNEENQQVCITELWYRRWAEVSILKAKNGRAVKFDPNNELHQAALATGRATLQTEVLPHVRRAYWMGPHRLHDGPSPYPHEHFPYVPVWGYREDMTGVPFGLVRDMLFPQDNLNASISKLRWGMSATRTERTKGAVAMDDAVFRRVSARVDADIVLDAEHMARPGARFDVKRDFQLNNQQFQLMEDSRRALGRVSGISPAFSGQEGTARSGIQEQTQLEQSQVGIADLMDNFKEARRMVGELLMAMIIEDMGREEQTIVIEGDTLNPPRTVVLNHPETDPATGLQYLSNDVQRTRLKVALEDVPSSSSFRAQQLRALSESTKGAPPDLQRVTLPFMVDLMDLPRKKEVVQAIQAAAKAPDPDQMREEIRRELMFELKERELSMREAESEAKIKKLMAEAVQTGVQAAFSAMQGGAQVAQMPMIAPIADKIMQGAGYQRPDPMGDDPNFPVPNGPAPDIEPVGDTAVPPVRNNTSPTFPPVPDDGASPMRGIETAETEDNLPV
ncbi:hypothetical protein [Parazoarcus communis]|uniref:Portal protein n=1 Tax=Parazoarcus communis SWub3 = DSM 12120 TaxID=1121029 RepID=A0A323UR82_9RHOO|nr:hypothetical protein [Parazoarcus communis]NMG71827.1 hypothetical protein [Parazoarcus communis SWub3 = DSM 12120]PZA14939.1 hypothetical protein DNK49_19030 [Azoarcus communis] [Parazoarcus communis SWub3 = DSM 12120]